MAYYSTTMNQVKQIFQLHHQGVAIKRIAAILHISKNTVKGYLRRINEMGIDISEVLAIDNPILEEQLKPVSNQEKINYQEFLLRAEYYADELSNRRKTHVTRMLLWEELPGRLYSHEVLAVLLSSSAVSEKQASFFGAATSTRR